MPADISMDHAGPGRRENGLTALNAAAATAAQKGRQRLRRWLAETRKRLRSAHPASSPLRWDLRELEGMSDHMLSDIGLTRDDVRNLRRTYHL